jgi:predicted  nucleic acid-binding Zn-ribbon protein
MMLPRPRRYVPRPKPDTGFVCPKCGNVFYRALEWGDRACIICGWVKYRQNNTALIEAKQAYQEACRLCGYLHIWGAPCQGELVAMRSRVVEARDERAQVAREVKAEGYSRNDIAEILGVHERTVDRYMKEATSHD